MPGSIAKGIQQNLGLEDEPVAQKADGTAGRTALLFDRCVMKNIQKKHIIWGIVSVVLIVIAIVATCVAQYWNTVLVTFFGTVGGGASGTAATDENGEAIDTEYYKSDYTGSDGKLDTAKLQEADNALNLQMAEEGSVLLYNNDALPLDVSTEKNVSVFSISSRSWLTGGAGSGAVTLGTTSNVKTSLESAGFVVNPTLWDFYGTMSKYGRGAGTTAGGGGEVGDWKINEVPQSEYTNDVKTSYSSYNDAAVVIIARSGGEGGDLPRDMSNFDGTADEHYLQLNSDEKDMLTALKSAGFKKTIEDLNMANAFQMEFLSNANLDTYGVDAVITLPGTGTNGLEALGELLSGAVNPSGRTVDTYVYDNMSAPAMQNFGWNVYTDASGKVLDYSFVNYAEGIYVDYKYYETRYEDSVLGAANVGTYSYADTVYAPFGYGLSYTSFEYSDYTLTLADGSAISADTEITPDTELKASVTVTNTGSAAGKDVVEFYFQSPYTDYDKTNGVEKSASELVDFYKTDILAAADANGENGGSEVASVTFKVSEMASYDSTQAKTYILDPGTYYVTAATDAHQAVNNILLQKAEDAGTEYTLVGEGSADLAAGLDISGTEGEPIKVSTDAGDLEVTNEFDNAKAEDAAYLSRSNWTAMDGDGLKYATGTTKLTGSDTSDAAKGKQYTAGTRQVTDSTLASLQASGWSNSGRPSSKDDSSDVLYGQTLDFDMAYMVGASYDDERWETLVTGAKISELHKLFNNGAYNTHAISSINKPDTQDYDGPAGVSNYVNGQGGYGFCCEALIAATWSKDLAYRFGLLIGEDGLKLNTAGWYAPAVNIHRTPFSGRNYEYFSSDDVLSGMMGASVVKGAQEKGMYTYVKHFALNDQESYRSDYGNIATWAQEQAIRETYLHAFQITIEDGGAHAVMSSMNRIGTIRARGNYNLLTNVLRGEWGFEGMIITDYINSDSDDADQVLSAGGDLILNNPGIPLNDTSSNIIRHALQEAACHVLFVVANSMAMNGLAPGLTYKSGFAVYNFIIIAIWVVFAAAIAVWAVFIFKKKKGTGAGTDADAAETTGGSKAE